MKGVETRGGGSWIRFGGGVCMCVCVFPWSKFYKIKLEKNILQDIRLIQS